MYQKLISELAMFAGQENPPMVIVGMVVDEIDHLKDCAAIHLDIDYLE